MEEGELVCHSSGQQEVISTTSSSRKMYGHDFKVKNDSYTSFSQCTHREKINGDIRGMEAIQHVENLDTKEASVPPCPCSLTQLKLVPFSTT